MRYRPIKLPADALPHEAIIEWWYFNGHLHDKRGRAYAFMDCFFKADIKKIKLPYLRQIPFKEKGTKLRYIHFAHSVVSDIARQKSYKQMQNISLVSRDSFQRPLLYINYLDPILVNGYTNSEIAETSPFSYHLKTEYLDLQLTSRKKPLLEGGKGFVSVCGRETYYYSLTDLKTEGMIRIEDRWVEVEGKSWMDHQWADVSYGQDKWTWFSLQLEDGTDIMCVEYDDHKTKEYLVDVIDKHGVAQHSKRLRLTPGKDTWTSKKTKSRFPMSWEIEIPDQNIRLKVRSLMSDQEMIYSTINYWEGPLEVVCQKDGKEVKGQGFMELVGYASDYNYLMLASKELNRKIHHWVSDMFKKL